MGTTNGPGPPFTHRLRVRYAEVDAQGVVFNAHWLTYADDAATRFFEHLGVPLQAQWGGDGDPTWDVMLRASTLEWSGSAGFDDEVAIVVTTDRLGTSSFDLRFTCHVHDQPVVTVTTTYVCVVPQVHTAQPLPADLRARLEGART